MGDAAGPLGLQEGVIWAPSEGIFAHKPVIGTVKISHEMICKIQRKFAAGGPVELGADAVAENVLRNGHGPVQFSAANGGQIVNCSNEVGIRFAHLL